MPIIWGDWKRLLTVRPTMPDMMRNHVYELVHMMDAMRPREQKTTLM